MVSSPASSAREHGSGMGTVFADIVVSNKRDEILAEAGHLAASAIRREPIEQVLVDTGASTLCLPRDVIERLGLPVKRTVVAITATGEVETTVHEQANLSVAGRSGVVECIALPEGSRPLLGVIPLEMLGLEPDLATHTLRVLPDDTKDSYIFLY